MQGKTHMVIGSAVSLLLMPKLGYETTLLTTAAAAIGALVPDIDHPKAMINQRILPFKNKSVKILVYSGSGIFVLFKGIEKKNLVLIITGILLIMIGISQHRGFTHSLLGIGLISFVIHEFFKSLGFAYLGFAFEIGIFSHTIADYFTAEGIKIWYPFSKQNYKFPLSISTGGVIEKVLNIMLVGILINRFFV